MSSNTYRCCGVRECRNTSIKTPGKLWIIVPSVDTDMRNTWLKLAGRDPNSLSIKTPLYFCEDHFDLENDMENYMQYKIMGSVRTIRMKPKCVPSKFDCRDNPKPKSPTPRKKYAKRQRMSNVRKNEYQDLLTGEEFCNLVYKVDKEVQVSPVQEHKSVQILLKNLEPKQSSTDRKEIKMFCMKCKTEVLHTAEAIQEEQTRALIAKVFHYFEEELKLLKKMKAKLKLSHLSKFHERTAQATGVSEATVLEILQEEARRKTAKTYEQPQNAVTQREVLQNAEEPPQKRRRVRNKPSQAESSNEQRVNDVAVGQPSGFQQMILKLNSEEVILKDEPVAYDDEQAQTVTITTKVKMEPYNDETDDLASVSTCSRLSPAPSSSLRREGATSRARSQALIESDLPKPEPSLSSPLRKRGKEKDSSTAGAPRDYPLSRKLDYKLAIVDPLLTVVKKEPDDEMNEKHIEEESSTAVPPRDYPLSGKLDKGRLMEVRQVKVEKIEIEEEGLT